MLKRISTISLLILVVGVLVFGAVNRTLAKTGSASGSQSGYGYNGAAGIDSVNLPTADFGLGNGGRNRRAGQGGGLGEQGEGAYLPPAQTGDLGAVETEALVYMREEEKLAHDVYLALYEQWGLPVFQNISQSEQTHTEAVKTLLERYGISDPASASAGVFSNPDLQALYEDLVAQGSQSPEEALKVGIAVEEQDILDLQAYLAQVDNADIQQVFNNLLKGSNNHLRAFTQSLGNQGNKAASAPNSGAGSFQHGSGTVTENNGRGAGQGGYRGGRP